MKTEKQKITFRKFPTGGQLLNEENLLNGIVPPHIDLTIEQFNEISSQNCRYCGDEPKLTYKGRMYNGIERIKMADKFDYNNTIACCRDCAQVKMGRDEDRMVAFIKACIPLRESGDIQQMVNSFR